MIGQTQEKKIEIDPRIAPQLIGKLEENIRIIGEGLKIMIYSRGNVIILSGPDKKKNKAEENLNLLEKQYKKG